MLENEKKENEFNGEESDKEGREERIQNINEQQEDIFAEEDVAIPEEGGEAPSDEYSAVREEAGAASADEYSAVREDSGEEIDREEQENGSGNEELSGQQTEAGSMAGPERREHASEPYRYSYVHAAKKQDQEEQPPVLDKKHKEHKKHMSNYAKAIVCAILCGVIVGGCVIGSFAVGRNMTQTASTTVETNADKLSTAADSDSGSDSADSDGTEYTVAQIAEECSSSVVAITTKSISEVQTMFGTYQQESEGSGSGVIVSQTDSELLIVTNYHVIEGSEELTVCFNDSEDSVYTAQIKGTDSSNDLAVVAIPLSDISEDDLNSISIATIGDSDSLQVGDGVVAIGNALGMGQSVTSGIISALDREVTVEDVTSTLLQTDAAINPGNSGGALFNMKGELIGINSAKYASDTIEGMGFAIPMATAQPIIEELMTQETRTKLTENYGCLNITAQDVSSEAAEMYGVPEGVYVFSVLEGGAAANAGIQQGDIITAIDGTTLGSVSDLQEELQYYAAGETVDITIQRNSGSGYEEQTVSVTLDNASEQDSDALQESASQNSQGGYSNGDVYGTW